MKTLFYVGYPLGWAKGGFTSQIMETKRGLERLGVGVEWLHHEDIGIPRADIMHYWGRPPSDFHWQLAKKYGLKVVISDLNPQSIFHPHWTWRMRGMANYGLKTMIGHLYNTLGLGIYPNCDASINLSPYEAQFVRLVYHAPKKKSFVIPNGVDPIYFDDTIKGIDFDGLVYVAYILDEKNQVSIARAAKKAGVRVKFIGGAQSGEDEYFRLFKDQIDNRYVYWEGEVTDVNILAALIRGSKGSFMASQNEAQSISILESLACGKPVMMSNLQNLRSFYGDNIEYCHQPDKPEFINELKTFYSKCCNGLTHSFPVYTWGEISRQIYDVYKQVLKQDQ